jgi:negative regulator of sigma E activity
MSDDPKLSQRYRDLPREEPPRALDETILAASRRAVESRRWYFPVAAAAAIVLAVAVVVHIDREQPDTEVVTPQAKILETPPAPQPKAEAPRAAPEPRAESAGPARGARAPAAAEARRDREADSLARMQVQRAPATASLTAQTPEQWLQGIADLRRQGRDEEADRELAEFRKRYPDYRLSDEMKAKVERRQ